MKLLKEFYYDQDKFCNKYRFRRAARTILINEENEIALMNVSNQNYYKLPGGGFENDEDVLKALKREVTEEVGNCEIKIIDELGFILEVGNEFELVQVSYCFVASVKGKIGLPNYTKSEQEDGFKTEWHPIDKIIKLMQESKPKVKMGERITQRDLTFLREYFNSSIRSK